jgi:hypothetical protein
MLMLVVLSAPSLAQTGVQETAQIAVERYVLDKLKQIRIDHRYPPTAHQFKQQGKHLLHIGQGHQAGVVIINGR